MQKLIDTLRKLAEARRPDNEDVIGVISVGYSLGEPIRVHLGEGIRELARMLNAIVVFVDRETALWPIQAEVKDPEADIVYFQIYRSEDEAREDVYEPDGSV
jgi:hypothetical protein